MAVNLSYITLFVGDFTECVSFYRNGLGLKVAHESPSFVQFRTGGTVLALHAATDSSRHTRGLNLHFDVPDLADAVTTLRARGVRFDGEPKDEPWGAKVARTTDPAGTVVEIVQWADR